MKAQNAMLGKDNRGMRGTRGNRSCVCLPSSLHSALPRRKVFSHPLSSILHFLWLFLILSTFAARAAFVYETPAEFLSSGDFNGDGISDVLVVDKTTGNARVGFRSPGGTLTWSAPLATGAEHLNGCGLADFFLAGHDSLAVTAPDLNRVNLVDLSNTNSAPDPTQVTPTGIGPHTVIGLASPQNPPPSALPYLLVASSYNDSPPERLDFFALFGAPLFYAFLNETGSFERGNALDLNTNTPTFAVGLVRGATNNTLQIWQFTNSPGSIIGTLSNLPPGSDYVFGNFNSEPLPRFWCYVPGGTNIFILPLQSAGAGFDFGPAINANFTQAIEHVYYVGQGTNGSALIQFGDGVQGARLPGGTLSLAPKYSTGAGASGHVTGIAALSDGKFALLTAPTGTLNSASARVMSFDGTNYSVISSNSLSPLTTRSSRATVWLFQTEPFVTASPSFVASLNAPDWSSLASGLPGSLAVRVESDSGASGGLGNPTTNNYTPASGSVYGLPDQYRSDISLLSYSSPRAAEAAEATISPSPGIYDGPITISFTKVYPSLTVFYRLGGSDPWQMYGSPFPLTHDATVQFYARAPGGPAPPRSPLHFASYQLGTTGETPPDPLVLPGSENTNAPPGIITNLLQLSAGGTVFYSRHTTLAELDAFPGPSPYARFADSPFYPNGFSYFYLEDFEDGAFNVPGATPSAGWIVAGPSINTDSVDADDGTINGSGAGGHSYYSGGTQTNLTITFNAAALGGHLPTHAGIVWTDVGIVTSGTIGHGTVFFSARDAQGVSLGTQVAVNLGDGVGSATTAEDRFFGIVNPGGISSISITMTNSKDWEVDHVQYGYLDSAGFNDSIWAINLDGTGETFITEGSHPRVSRHGQWLAFLREGGGVISQGNLWVRNLNTGLETRIYANADSIMGFDWNSPLAELVFDNNCLLWRETIGGPITQLSAALTPECYNGAPVVNPVDGRLAFHNVNPSGPMGVYVAPALWSSRSILTEPTTLRWRWPSWSSDGSQLAMADQVAQLYVNTGVNLWTIHADGSSPRQVTALSGADGFPRGAIWTPSGRALVGAGVVGGVNGLWVVPLGSDGGACHCPPLRLPTSPGSDIDFAGSILQAPTEVVGPRPGLFIRSEPSAVVVHWSTDYAGYSLESATSLRSNEWSSISGPYFLASGYYEYREAKSALAAAKFFRLHYPGVFYLTPSAPTLSVTFAAGQEVLAWPADYAGYTLEVTTNLAPPVSWTPVPGTFSPTNGYFEFRRDLITTKPQEYFRLRGP